MTRRNKKLCFCFVFIYFTCLRMPKKTLKSCKTVQVIERVLKIFFRRFCSVFQDFLLFFLADTFSSTFASRKRYFREKKCLNARREIVSKKLCKYREHFIKSLQSRVSFEIAQNKKLICTIFKLKLHLCRFLSRT